MTANLFPELARIARYPDANYHARAAAALSACPGCGPLQSFAAAVASESLANLQELYTRTFDLNPICAPEIGWHLFGENYERGAFLVRMKSELRRHSMAESSELPDHLACAIELFGRMSLPDAEFFAVACVAPALHKMLAAVPAGNIFRDLLLAIRSAVEEVVPECREMEPAPVKLAGANKGALV